MKKLITLILLTILTFSLVAAQKRKPKPERKPKEMATMPKAKSPMIFAVWNDGTTLDPIAFVEKGKLMKVADEDAAKLKANLTDNYYKFGTTYRLIFGGSDAGKATVTERGDGDCTGNQATATVESERAKLKGVLMALATDAVGSKDASGTRRLPTTAERAEINKLVKAEFLSRKNTAKTLQTLKYQNLTALDLDNDGKAEMVGSFWVSPTASTRNLLFFIAEKNASGNYVLGYKSYNSYAPKQIMSHEAKDLDGGIYHELLLDVFDYDGDGDSEIFTLVQGFEGNSYNVYKKAAGKWVKAFETDSYRCAY